MTRLVVGAAIVEHRRVLAARRRHPADAAGRWELPGGKVDADESPDEALVREIAEELGCAISVESWLTGEESISADLVLWAAHCTLVSGRPQPGADHDEVVWLAAGELGSVDWLAPDRPFLPAVRDVLLGSTP